MRKDDGGGCFLWLILFPIMFILSLFNEFTKWGKKK